MFREAVAEPLSLRFAELSLQDQGIDFTKPGYRSGWRLLGHVAEHMGLDVDGKDLAHWAMNLGVMRAIDDFVDERGQTDVRAEVARVAAGQPIAGVSLEEAAAFASVMEDYNPKRAEAQIEGLNSFPDHAARKRAATTVGSLAEAIKGEARMFAGLLELPRNGPADADTDCFNDWLHHFSAVGYLLDSCVDLKEDYEAGNSRVEPRLKARLGMARLALSVLPGVLYRTPMLSLGQAAATGRAHLKI